MHIHLPTRSCAALAVVLLAAVGAACDSSPLTAPTNSVIKLYATPATVASGGRAEVVASVVKPGGAPAQNGTVVTFATTLGSITPSEAKTTDGKATVQFVAGAETGTAKVSAFSGGAVADAIEIIVK